MDIGLRIARNGPEIATLNLPDGSSYDKIMIASHDTCKIPLVDLLWLRVGEIYELIIPTAAYNSNQGPLRIGF